MLVVEAEESRLTCFNPLSQTGVVGLQPGDVKVHDAKPFLWLTRFTLAWLRVP
jgi:hypothetical protein